MRLYTRTGDKGKTSLFGGCQVGKNDKKIVACGAIDELNSWLGVLRSEIGELLLAQIQDDLMIIGSFLGGAERLDLSILEKRVREMEDWIERQWQNLPKLDNFIVPSGSKSSSFVHVVRAVCRRAEREVVKVKTDKAIIKYLNRLADFLFVLARAENQKARVKEKVWKT